MLKFERNTEREGMQDRTQPRREWWTARIRDVGFAHVYEDATAECWRVQVDTSSEHRLYNADATANAAMARAHSYVRGILKAALAELETDDA